MFLIYFSQFLIQNRQKLINETLGRKKNKVPVNVKRSQPVFKQSVLNKKCPLRDRRVQKCREEQFLEADILFRCLKYWIVDMVSSIRASKYVIGTMLPFFLTTRSMLQTLLTQ